MARECAEEIIESGIEFVEVNTHKAGIYLKINNSEEDNAERKIDHLLPKRKSNKGRKPGMRTKELRRRTRVKNKGEEEVKELYHEEIDDSLKDGDKKKNEQDTEEDEESKWWPGKRPNKEETTRLAAYIIENMIKVIMRNHYYKFLGKIYHQEKGGAIGLSLTGKIARVTMDRWMRKMVERTEENKMKI